MASGEVSSKELVKGYLRRIDSLNPLLHSVIETNPNAVSIAEHLDNERRRGHVRGPLHGIPILVKDNIATDDKSETTAGSLALLHSRVPADAVIIQQLRAAGAVILGKANLGEWANFRGTDNVYPHAVGWSARGGNTINAYDLSYTSWGSSAGSANGAAANLCSVAVWDRDGWVNHRSVCRREYRWVETDLGARLPRRDYTNFSSARHSGSDGTQRLLTLRCLLRRVAVALWRSARASASE